MGKLVDTLSSYKRSHKKHPDPSISRWCFLDLLERAPRCASSSRFSFKLPWRGHVERPRTVSRAIPRTRLMILSVVIVVKNHLFSTKEGQLNGYAGYVKQKIRCTNIGQMRVTNMVPLNVLSTMMVVNRILMDAEERSTFLQSMADGK